MAANLIYTGQFLKDCMRIIRERTTQHGRSCTHRCSSSALSSLRKFRIWIGRKFVRASVKMWSKSLRFCHQGPNHSPTSPILPAGGGAEGDRADEADFFILLGADCCMGSLLRGTTSSLLLSRDARNDMCSIAARDSRIRAGAVVSVVRRGEVRAGPTRFHISTYASEPSYSP